MYVVSLVTLLFLAQAREPIRVGPGVTPPRVLQKAEPEYTAEARQQGVQGTLLLALTIDEQGRPVHISVISPIGFGLDERAVETVAKWRFAPATKDGKPVAVTANLEMTFQFLGAWYDEKAEKRWTQYNGTNNTLGNPSSDPKRVERAVASMQELAAQRYVPAQYMLGMWKLTGKHVAKDEAAGLDLVRKAADKNHGPAIFELARRQLDAEPKSKAALEEARRAALLGSTQAQFYLASRAERGLHEPVDLERARRYYRLCASAKIAECRLRLGRLMLAAAARESDRLQALAWLDLAADEGLREAQGLRESESAKLSPEQLEWVRRLKEQLARGR